MLTLFPLHATLQRVPDAHDLTIPTLLQNVSIPTIRNPL
jgi:hypothetical protein